MTRGPWNEFVSGGNVTRLGGNEFFSPRLVTRLGGNEFFLELCIKLRKEMFSSR